MKQSGPSGTKVVILDFDGTIADSFEVFAATFNIVTKRKQPFTPEEIEDLRKSSLSDIIRKTGVKKWQIPRLMLQGKREIRKRMGGVKPFKDMPSVIKQLSESGYELHILSTNSKVVITDFLHTYKLDRYIRSISADIGLFGKVQGLKRLQQRANLTSQECVYVGDETRDIEAAKKARIQCISVAWGYNHTDILQAYHPTLLVNQPGDLLKAIQNI